VHRFALPLLALAVLTAGCGGSSPRPPAASPAALPAPAGAQEAVVVSVADGDTVHLRGRGVGPVPAASTRVRLLLVDTPEVFGRTDCYGPEASARTKQLLPPGTSVRVQGDTEARDRYGRLLLHVWRPDGVSVGERLVSEGYARVLQVDPNRRYLDAFRSEEAQAKRAGRGLWAACR
jgi:micrococcal nuclease